MPTGEHFRKGSVRFAAETEAKKMLRHKGKEYWAPQHAIAYLKHHVAKLNEWRDLTGLAVLNRWEKDACAWLGRTVRFTRLAGTFGRPLNYPLADDIKKIASVMNGQDRAPYHPGFMLLDHLAEELGCHRDHVLWLHRKWRKATGRTNKDKPALKWGLTDDGHPVRRSYVSDGFAKWARRRRTPEAMAGDEILARDVADEQGKRRSSLLAEIARTKVPTRKVRVLALDGRTREMCVIAATEKGQQVALTQRQFDVLDRLYALEAFDKASLETIESLARVLNADRATLLRSAAQLKRLGLVDSSKGRCGGYFLTLAGRATLKKPANTAT